MMTFIYIIMFISLYIVFGITIFGIGYKYDFMDIRKDYKQSVCQGDEYSTIVMSIIFWPLIAACFLLFSIPRRIIDSFINAIDEDIRYELIDEDIRYEELLRNKQLKKNKDNYNDNDNNIKL